MRAVAITITAANLAREEVTMKKSLRILTVLVVAASSILFATPSQAAVLGAVTVTTEGNINSTTLSANSVYYTSSGGSYSSNDKVIFDIAGRQFSFANLNEASYTSSNYTGTNLIGVPSTPVTNFDVTINMTMGYAYGSTGDIYVDGTRVIRNLSPSYSSGTRMGTRVTYRGPLLQLNYKISTGLITLRLPITTSGATDARINSDGTYSVTGGSITSWSDLTTFAIGAPPTSVPTTTSPSAPTSVVATATGKRSATVSFAAPASDGGSAVTSYTATSSPGGLTHTLTQATGGTFAFDGLQPGTAYTFAVTATNAIGTSAAATSNSVTTTPLTVASLSALSFVDDGTGTGGKIVWSGKNIDAVLYTGSATYYPGPYNYGAFTSGWNGRIRNLTPDTSYTVSIFAISADGVGESKSLTFKTSATLPALAGAKSATTSQADQMAAQLPKLLTWINENVFVDGEGDRMKTVLNKFDAIKAPTNSAYLKLPNPTVLTVSATSSTPAVCTVEGQVTVHSIAAGTCTISYTVVGASKAPATLVKDFVFKKFAK